MYPDWPESTADLVPLPNCDGPKLKPFVFPHASLQRIEFLECLGEGMHSHVFKIKILQQIYALKLFRFLDDSDWLDAQNIDPENVNAMRIFYNYSEPFSCECRAYSRLQENSHEELAVQCFGYLLLSEGNERTIMNQFDHFKLSFEGNMDMRGVDDIRPRFLGKDSRPPPIRGIVKEFGCRPELLYTKDMRRVLGNMIRIQQLGIINLDMAAGQLINGKLCDFSQALTAPHYFMTPELNPNITPEWVSVMNSDIFRCCINDYWRFDEMVDDWNTDHRKKKKKIPLLALPGYKSKYELRAEPSRDRVCTLVDPRLYDWKNCSAAEPGKQTTGAFEEVDSRRRKNSSSCVKSESAISRTRQRISIKPAKWCYYTGVDAEMWLRFAKPNGFGISLAWELRDGLIFPVKKVW